MLSNIYKYLIEVATLTIPTLCIFMEAGFACLSYECVALAIIVLSYTDIHQSSYAIDEQRDYTAIVWDPGGPYRSTNQRATCNSLRIEAYFVRYLPILWFALCILALVKLYKPFFWIYALYSTIFCEDI